MAFRLAGVIIPQFVELPDGDRFFTINRTVLSIAPRPTSRRKITGSRCHSAAS